MEVLCGIFLGVGFILGYIWAHTSADMILKRYYLRQIKENKSLDAYEYYLKNRGDIY